MSEAPSDANALDAGSPEEYAPERPRFPYAVAAFALACVVCAAWLWMRYSYLWTVSTDALADGPVLSPGKHVRIEARAGDDLRLAREWGFVGDGVLCVRRRDGPESERTILLVWDARIDTVEPDELFPLVGRVAGPGPQPITINAVETPVGRFTPESVAGLVVAAMGAGVFALYFRKWLAERRVFRTPPRAAA